MDKISIITVTYNCVNILESTILSVLKQDYQNVEYIVVDGQSTDGTIDLVRTYGPQISKFVSEKDSGIYDAMNKGINLCTGDWIFFLNAGDVFTNENVLSTIFRGENCSGHDVVYGDHKVKFSDKIVYQNNSRAFYLNEQWFHGMGFSHQSVFVRTNKAKENMFDLSYKCCADYNMMMQLFKSGAKFKYVSIPIALVEGRGGYSLDNWKIQLKDIARILQIDDTLKFKIYYAYRKMRKTIKSLFTN